MNRIDQTFANLRQQNKKALVTFMTGGDPDHDTSLEILKTMASSGADIIEIGMPFSDPMADGPIIQAASQRALTAGATLESTLELAKSFRVTDTKTPLILMGYFNPIYTYGTDRFAKKAKEYGVDGLIIADTPPEEDQELYDPARKNDLHMIRLVTPTTHPDRLEVILDRASGFIYYVSIAGITGTQSASLDNIRDHLSMVRQKSEILVAIGFGIKTPEDAAAMAKGGDAIVVGSSLVQTIEMIGHGTATLDDLSKQISDLSEALS